VLLSSRYNIGDGRMTEKNERRTGHLRSFASWSSILSRKLSPAISGTARRAGAFDMTPHQLVGIQIWRACNLHCETSPGAGPATADSPPTPTAQSRWVT
jgi:hypothetical protein